MVVSCIDPRFQKPVFRYATMGYRKLSARPRHYAQVEGVIEDFKKVSPPVWMQSRARRRSSATR